MALQTVAGRPAIRKLEDVKIFQSTYTVSFEKIIASPGWNIRTIFDGIEELAADIEKNGLREPLLVDVHPDGSVYSLVDGERRYRAISLLRQNGTVFDRVEVRPTPYSMTMLDKLIGMIGSGVHKKEYSALELSTGIGRLKEDHQLTNEQIAERLGNKSRQWVDMMLILASASDQDKRRIQDGELSWTTYVNRTRKKKEPEISKEQQVADMHDALQKQRETALEDLQNEPLLNSNDVVVPLKDPSIADENHGIINTKTLQRGDNPLDVQDLEKEMVEEAQEDETKVRDPEIDMLLKRILKNTNWIESIGKHLPDQAATDLDTRLGWIRSDIESVRLELKGKLKR